MTDDLFVVAAAVEVVRAALALAAVVAFLVTREVFVVDADPLDLAAARARVMRFAGDGSMAENWRVVSLQKLRDAQAKMQRI